MKTETEICKTEVEMEFFMQKQKKTEPCFPGNMHGNGTFRFREYGISVFTIDL